MVFHVPQLLDRFPNQIYNYGMEETTDGFCIPQIWETTNGWITWQQRTESSLFKTWIRTRLMNSKPSICCKHYLRQESQVPDLLLSQPLIESSTFLKLQSIMSAQSETDQSKFVKLALWIVRLKLINYSHSLTVKIDMMSSEAELV